MTNPHTSGGVALEAKSSNSEARGAPGALVLDLLDWLAREPRTHRETIETWGSHCPRITPWEDAQESGLVQVTRNRGNRRATRRRPDETGPGSARGRPRDPPGRAAPVDGPTLHAPRRGPRALRSCPEVHRPLPVQPIGRKPVAASPITRRPAWRRRPPERRRGGGVALARVLETWGPGAGAALLPRAALSSALASRCASARKSASAAAMPTRLRRGLGGLDEDRPPSPVPGDVALERRRTLGARAKTLGARTRRPARRRRRQAAAAAGRPAGGHAGWRSRDEQAPPRRRVPGGPSAGGHREPAPCGASAADGSVRGHAQ